MKLSQLITDLTDARVCADLDTEIGDICYDSRHVKPGDLFVAVVGYASDGHKYIDMAVKKGAACVLCQRPPEGEVPYVQVENTRAAMSLVSARLFGRPADKMKIIGVTGTNGKTTATNLVKTVLETVRSAKVGLIGTNANMIGDKVIDTERTTPESRDLQALFADMAAAGCDYVVMEVSSHALYLDRVRGVTFAVGAFTNLTEDHLDFHHTMEEYARCKSLLFNQCVSGIANLDDEWCGTITANAKCPVLTYSAKQPEAQLYADNVSLNSDGVTFDAVLEGERAHVTLGIPGMFSVYNAMTAIAVCHQLGIGLEETAKALAKCRGVMGRAEIVPIGRDFTVMIDYAHTPDALENIVTTVQGYAKGRVVTLFGCGGDRDRLKRPIMGKIAVDNSDFVIVTSDNPRTEKPMDIINDILPGLEGSATPYAVIENRRDAIKWALENAQKDDVIILAGKGHETYQEIDHVKHHFDEREVVYECLGEIG